MSVVHCVTPYDVSKNLGKSYNETMSRIPSDDWACITDWDVLFLLPETIAHLNEYTRLFPDTGIFTCYGSRTHHINTGFQGLPSGPSDDRDMLNHINIAKKHTEQLYTITPINRFISGFLMMIKKETWDQYKFVDNMKCLDVDNIYSNKIIQNGLTIQRMNGIYVWHTYRLGKDIKDTSHLL